MRLYLSSYRLGNHSDELLKLLGGKTKAALIANAVDFRTPEEIKERNKKDIKELTDFGLDVTEVDLKEYFGKKAELEVELRKYYLLWVRGGNAFVLRKAMEKSSADEIIKQLLQEDALVYGGYSAGMCILSPTMKGVDLVDDLHLIPQGYEPGIIWEGLDVVPYSLIPHYQSNHPESEAVNEVVTYLETKQIPFKAIRDGEVLIIYGNHELHLK